jgi:excinuclease ABC subunit C
VYLFKDTKGRTIYVGKAKRIRDRVRSHLSGNVDAPKQEAMLHEAVGVDFIATDNELEALTLENSLIKQNRPKFNVLLRDDKNYPYLRLTLKERFPRLQYVRGVEDDGSRYFGPYAPAATAHNTQRLIYRNFGLRPCNIDIDGSWDRPCLYYDIGECAGPCVSELCSEERYAEVTEEALKYLEGKGEDLRADLERKMAKAAAEQHYELAAHYRDLLETVRLTAREQKVATTGLDDRDFFALHRRGERLALQVFLVRRGIVVERKQFFWDDVGDVPDEILLSMFLQQYYDGEQLIPPEICVPMSVPDRELLEAWLRHLRGRTVHIHRPQRGAKKRLLELVTQNAELALASRVDPGADERGAAILQTLLDMNAPPEVIECVDVSNTQGGEIVAGLVRFREGVADKSGYKRFRIKGLAGPDDVRSMAQAVGRHLKRVSSGERPAPDLLLVDGGRGQLNAALAGLEENGLAAQPVAAIAKQEEELYLPGTARPVPLQQYPEALRLVQRIRDEAHRFAISYHRALRQKRIVGSALEEVPGIGPTRRKLLLRRFGSVEGVRQAAREELAEVVGEALATRLHEALSE